MLRDAVQSQIGTVHHVRLTAAFGGTDRVIVAVVVQPGVLRSCREINREHPQNLLSKL